MKIATECFSFKSSHDGDTICARKWICPNTEPVGIIQIVHGMAEHSERYDEYASILASEGYVVVADDHLGHGESATAENYGFFANRDGYRHMTRDLHTLTVMMKEQYSSDIPYILLGHSMGSFLARKYAADYPGEIDVLILSGTAGKNPLSGIGIAIAKIIRGIKGERYRSPMIQKLAFGAYNKKYPEKKTAHDWLTRDEERIAMFASDSRCGFQFTISGYIDLFYLLREVNSGKWYKSIPKDLPVLLYAGDMDPVGNYGKGVTQVYNKLVKHGNAICTLKLYPDARHELHNETNRDEMFDDIKEYLSDTLV